MHREILDDDQQKLLPLVRLFKKSFYLVGGTAIALQIGHRRSVDFDLFRDGNINAKVILDKIKQQNYSPVVTRNAQEQLNLIVNKVKFTFFQYPFKIGNTVKLDDFITMPPLIDLAAMKAYALGRRSKWKDYVDLYFLLTRYFSIADISSRASAIFGELFSEKLFRAQLSYFVDIDYSEEVEFMVDSPSPEEIKRVLTDKAVEL